MNFWRVKGTKTNILCDTPQALVQVILLIAFSLNTASAEKFAPCISYDKAPSLKVKMLIFHVSYRTPWASCILNLDEQVISSYLGIKKFCLYVLVTVIATKRLMETKSTPIRIKRKENTVILSKPLIAPFDKNDFTCLLFDPYPKQDIQYTNFHACFTFVSIENGKNV